MLSFVCVVYGVVLAALRLAIVRERDRSERAKKLKGSLEAGEGTYYPSFHFLSASLFFSRAFRERAERRGHDER